MPTLFILQLAFSLLLPAAAGAQTAITPSVGDSAPDVALTSLDGGTVRLSDQLRRGPVVLVLLRGWPGYQCPFCTRQLADYLGHAVGLRRAAARVVFVYPGPTDGLKEHADAFLQAREMPSHFVFLIDPDYRFTKAYGLRWDAPGETAYPATFVIDESGTVRFARVSRAHGGRVPVADVLHALGRQ
jgi:peroxiredoxin